MLSVTSLDRRSRGRVPFGARHCGRCSRMVRSQHCLRARLARRACASSASRPGPRSRHRGRGTRALCLAVGRRQGTTRAGRRRVVSAAACAECSDRFVSWWRMRTLLADVGPREAADDLLRARARGRRGSKTSVASRSWSVAPICSTSAGRKMCGSQPDWSRGLVTKAAALYSTSCSLTAKLRIDYFDDRHRLTTVAVPTPARSARRGSCSAGFRTQCGATARRIGRM